MKDDGKTFECSADPMLTELMAMMDGIKLGKPETYQGQLRKILSNESIFGINLYEAGIGEKVEKMFLEEMKDRRCAENIEPIYEMIKSLLFDLMKYSKLIFGYVNERGGLTRVLLFLGSVCMQA